MLVNVKSIIKDYPPIVVESKLLSEAQKQELIKEFHKFQDVF